MHDDPDQLAHVGDGDVLLRHQTRARLRRWAFRWALFILLFGVAPATMTSTWSIALALVLFGGLPLAAHILWARSHPIDVPRPAPAVLDAPHPPYTPLGRLARIEDAAGQLRARGWVSQADHRAIRDRVVRLSDLVEVDATAVALGGTASPVVEREITRLHDTVLGLLDEAISSAAVAPGDADVDQRLQAQLDAMRSRRAAMDEVERRTDPSTDPRPGTGG